MHCSVLAADALRVTLADYYKRKGEVEKAAELLKEEVAEPHPLPEPRFPCTGATLRGWCGHSTAPTRRRTRST